MPLPPERKKELDGILQQLDAKGAPPEDIRAIAADFITRFGSEASPEETSFLSDVFGSIKDQALAGAQMARQGLQQGGAAGYGKAALGTAAAAFSPLAPATNLIGNVGRVMGAGAGVSEGDFGGGYQPQYAPPKAEVEKVFNVRRDRPTSGDESIDMLVDVIGSLIPVERVYGMAFRLGKAGLIGEIKKAAPADVAAKAEQIIAKSPTIPDTPPGGRLALPPGPETALPSQAGVMRTGPILGETGGLPPRQIADVTGIEAGRLRPGADIPSKAQMPPGVVEPLQPIATAPAGGRLARNIQMFGPTVPGRIFGEAQPFPYLPKRIAGKAEEGINEVVSNPASAQDALQWSGFRAQAKLEEKYAAEFQARSSKPNPVDAQKIQAKKAADVAPEVDPGIVAANEAKAPIELSRTQYGFLNNLGKTVIPEYDTSDLSAISSQLFGQGRTAPRTKAEYKQVVDFLRQFGRDTGKFDSSTTPQIPAATDFIDPSSIPIAPPSIMKKWWTGIDSRLISGGQVYIAKQGPIGKQLAQSIDEVTQFSGIRAGKAITELDRFKLNSAQKTELWKALDFGQEIKDPKLAAIAQTVRSRLDDMWEEFVSLGGEIRHLSGRNLPAALKDGVDYYPHLIKRSYLERNFKSAAQHLVDTGQAEDLGEAAVALRSYTSKHSVRRFGNMEKAREINLPSEFYETDPVKALTIYYSRGYRRLEEMERFGRNDEKALGMIEQMRNQGYDAESAGKIFNSMQGITEGTQFGNMVSSALRSWQIITKLTLYPITNSTQHFNTAYRTNVRSTTKALVDLVRPSTRGATLEFGRETGATLDEIVNSVARELGGNNSLVPLYLRAIGGAATERINRTVSSVAGKYYAKELAARLAANPKDKAAAFQLSRLGINPAEVTKIGLTNDDLLLAGRKIADETQFLAEPQSLPIAFNSPTGKVVFQFKTFMHRQTRLMKDELKVNFKTNPKQFAANLAKIVVMAPVVGEIGLDVKQVVREMISALGVGERPRERADTLGARLWDDYLALGAFGIFGDIAESVKYGERGLTNQFLGPTLSQAVETGIGVGRLYGSGSTTTLKRLARKQIPFLGTFQTAQPTAKASGR